MYPNDRSTSSRLCACVEIETHLQSQASVYHARGCPGQEADNDHAIRCSTHQTFTTGLGMAGHKSFGLEEREMGQFLAVC